MPMNASMMLCTCRMKQEQEKIFFKVFNGLKVTQWPKARCGHDDDKWTRQITSPLAHALGHIVTH